MSEKAIPYEKEFDVNGIKLNLRGKIVPWLIGGEESKNEFRFVGNINYKEKNFETIIEDINSLVYMIKNTPHLIDFYIEKLSDIRAEKSMQTM